MEHRMESGRQGLGKRAGRLRGDAASTKAGLPEEDPDDRAFGEARAGLIDRAQFLDRLRNALPVAWRRGHAVALLLLDLDGFHQVNRRVGHRIGDGLLIAVGRRLTEALQADGVATRLGGDEYAVVLEQVDGSQAAEQVAERLLAAVERPVMLGGRTEHVTTSIGIAITGPEPITLDVLFSMADAALARAKAAGRGCAILTVAGGETPAA
jgi:diguanylate cyclase (GGDEF)-like protein